MLSRVQQLHREESGRSSAYHRDRALSGAAQEDFALLEHQRTAQALINWVPQLATRANARGQRSTCSARRAKYARNNPVRFFDPSGHDSLPPGCDELCQSLLYCAANPVACALIQIAAQCAADGNAESFCPGYVPPTTPTPTQLPIEACAPHCDPAERGGGSSGSVCDIPLIDAVCDKASTAADHVYNGIDERLLPRVAQGNCYDCRRSCRCRCRRT